MKAEELTLLSEKVQQAVRKINSLREEKLKLSKLAEKQREDLNFFQKESRQAQKVLTQNQRLENERAKLRERIKLLLEKLEKAGI